MTTNLYGMLRKKTRAHSPRTAQGSKTPKKSRASSKTAAREQPRREHLLRTAYELFNARGYHATGIDTIMDASGVSKTTLYKYFASKEELILEVLRRRHEDVWAGYQDRIARSRRRHPDWPNERHLDAIFDVLQTWLASGDFFGCNFINASAEYGAADDPIHRLAAEHKQRLCSLIYELLSERPAARRKALAEQMLMLIDGAIVAAQVRSDRQAAKRAREMARILLSAG